MRRPLLILIAVAALVTAPVLTALPAAASPLAPARSVPADDTLLGLSCDWNRGSDRLELSTLDPATGVGTRIGISPETEIYFCAFSIAWDTVADSCTAFSIARGPDDPTALLRTDLRTGLSGVIAPITLNGTRVWASSLAIDDAGLGWVTYDNALYRIDLTTGALTPVVTITGASVAGLTLNPVDGQFYATDGFTIYRLDPTTGVATAVLTPDLSRGGGAPRIEGMAFDANGTLWITAMTFASLGLEIFEAEHELWSATLAGAPEFAGLISSRTEGVTIATLGLAVVPRVACSSLPTLPLPTLPEPAGEVPTLAATGLEDATPILLPVAALALALGALLVSSVRRERPEGGHRRGSRRGSR